MSDPLLEFLVERFRKPGYQRCFAAIVGVIDNDADADAFAVDLLRMLTVWADLRRSPGPISAARQLARKARPRVSPFRVLEGGRPPA
jgi:hypothetical protein